MAIPVYVPFAFIALLVGGLVAFSKIYRGRQAARTYEPWFPTHPERDTYITLLGLSTDPKPSEALLKAALLRRAVADVRRIFRIRDDKAALTALLAKGSISDEIWAKFQAAEKELEAEIVEVVTEANTFAEGWGQIIFQSAGEIVQNERHRDIYTGIAQKRAELAAKLGKATTPSQQIQLPPPPTSTPQTPLTSPPIAPPAASAPSITVAKPAPNNENLAPPASSSSATNGGISTPEGSPMKTPSLLPPLTPSKQTGVSSPPASIGKSAGKKKNKKK